MNTPVKITEEDAEQKLQMEKDTGNEGYYNVEHGMWLDVFTKRSSDAKIERHREVLTTRNNKSKWEKYIKALEGATSNMTFDMTSNSPNGIVFRFV